MWPLHSGRRQGFYFVYIPDVVLVSEAFHRFTSFRIAPVSQLAVAMNGVVAAPLQFIANGSLAGAGKAFDQIIPPAHVLENTHHEGQRGTRVHSPTCATRQHARRSLNATTNHRHYARCR